MTADASPDNGPADTGPADTGSADDTSVSSDLIPQLPGGIADVPAYPQRPPSAPLVPLVSSTAPIPPGTPPPGTSPPGMSTAAPPPPPSPPSPLSPPVPPAPAPAISAGPVHQGAVPEGDRNFVPLRTDPPPRLASTWWLRYMLLLTMMVCIAAVLMTEYAVGPGGVADEPVVIAPHVLVATLLVWWSMLALVDARRLVPRTRYHRSSSAPLVALLWMLAFSAPFAVLAVVTRADERFGGNPDDLATPAISAVAVVIGLVVVWLPFGYLAGQARRIGAPSNPFVLWFGASILAVAGAVAIVVLGLEEMLVESGTTAAERTLQTAVLYGVPAFVFALSMWRATTAFDEVVDLRWHRWRGEWELTLKAMAAEPPPGPELPVGADRE